MLKVLTVVGTRPELIKLSQLIPILDRNFQHILVHTGQNHDYELNAVFHDDLGIRLPDHYLGIAATTAMATIGALLPAIDNLLAQNNPDAFLIYGDTNSCLSLLAAKRRHIPIFHMEAGNRCFDQRVPEETNRKIIDHTSDINFPLTEHARDNLLQEGLRTDQIIKIGSCMPEVLHANSAKIQSSTILSKLKLTKGQFFVVSAHREENVDQPDPLRHLIGTLEGLASSYGFPVIVSTHPRTRKAMEKHGIQCSNPLIQIHKPFSYSDYNRLQVDALCTISDSGTITEESALLGFRAVTIRESHERPEGMDSGIVTLSPLQSNLVLDAVRFALSSDRAPSPVQDYSLPSPVWTVANAIQSYTHFVKRRIWNER